MHFRFGGIALPLAQPGREKSKHSTPRRVSSRSAVIARIKPGTQRTGSRSRAGNIPRWSG
jgi:hypothetical protein